MQRETVAGLDVCQSGDLGAAVDRVVAAVDLALHRLRRHDERHAVVQHVDDAADRLTAVAQRRGSAHDLDALRRKRIDRNAVIGADVRDVRGAGAVLEQANSGSVHAADDRSAGTGGEVGRGDAGHVLQRVGDVGTAGRKDSAAVDLGDDGGRIAAEGRRRDDDVLRRRHRGRGLLSRDSGGQERDDGRAQKILGSHDGAP